MDERPVKAYLRTYQVGFGDCFLLTFEYPTMGKRYVLIDFGSTGLPESAPRDQMLRVAQDIKSTCGDQGLAVVVASHRHKDHISGFSTDGEGDTTGKIIQKCKPKMVLQPWTENPDLAPDAKAPPGGFPGGDDEGTRALHMNYAKSLDHMHQVSEEIQSEVTRLASSLKFNKTLPQATVDRLNFLADDNGLRNFSAVKNLCEDMPGERHYLKYGDELKLDTILPGVTLKVLGPPTLEQFEKIKRQSSSNENEFWMLAANTAETSRELRITADSDEDEEDGLFPEAKTYDQIPASCRWFVRRLRYLRSDQLLQIVRILDNSMNNTSLILLFQAGKEKLLFPGDAQIENWEYALKHAPDSKKNLELLEQTTLYKVGHHGSRNATPKTLWNAFTKKSENVQSKDRLKTVVSTMLGKHGDSERHTEVPRQSLVDALNSESNYYSTQRLDVVGQKKEEDHIKFWDKKAGLWGEIMIEL